jgi:hypothetical protein
MDKILRISFFAFLVFALPACVSEDDISSDIADEYVGTWNYSDKEISSKDATTVLIEKISSDKIKIFGFHNLGSSISTSFSVFDHDLTITSSIVDGLPISGSGTSNYNYDEIVVKYDYDGDSYEATLYR